VSTQVASSRLAESEPPMCGMATLAMEVSSASMKVARVTVMAMTQGLARGRHVSWKEGEAAEASAGPFLELLKLTTQRFAENWRGSRSGQGQKI